MSSGKRNKSLRLILWGSSLPALLAASFLYYPRVFTGPVLCLMPLVFGMPCPGCGLTRAFCCMTHGRFVDALSYHPLAPLILAYFVFLWIVKFIETSRDEPLKLPAYRIGATACIVLGGFWVARLFWFFAYGNGLAVMAHDNVFARLSRLF